MARILVAGGGPLALAIKERLRQAEVQVDALGDNDWANDEALDTTLRGATALILAADSDPGNVDLALRARRKHPTLPIIVRLFDSGLAAYLTETIRGVTILSMSKAAAPVFAEAANRLLSRPSTGAPRKPLVHRSKHRRTGVEPVLARALLSLLLLVFPSAFVFAVALKLRYLDALYFVWTTVMTVGYGDIALKDAPDVIKVFGMALMLAGASFIAVLFALLSDWVLSRRLDLLRGRTRVRGRGHVLIVGAGNLGFRIVELLAREAHRPRMVIVERNADNRNISALRGAGWQTIIADATSRDVLDLAGLHSAAMVVAVTDSDAVNLQIALQAREHAVPVIMRVLSQELSAHVTQQGDWTALSPIVVAAESFAQAALSTVHGNSA